MKDPRSLFNSCTVVLFIITIFCWGNPSETTGTAGKDRQPTENRLSSENSDDQISAFSPFDQYCNTDTDISDRIQTRNFRMAGGTTPVSPQSLTGSFCPGGLHSYHNTTGYIRQYCSLRFLNREFYLYTLNRLLI